MIFGSRFAGGSVLALAQEALTKNYRRTEMWLYLPKELRPPASFA
jgi:hypothetical protein